MLCFRKKKSLRSQKEVIKGNQPEGVVILMPLMLPIGTDSVSVTSCIVESTANVNVEFVISAENTVTYKHRHNAQL